MTGILQLASCLINAPPLPAHSRAADDTRLAAQATT